MESASKVQAIKEAIKQLMTEEMIGNSTSSSSNDDDEDNHDRRLHRLLLAKLMSQLEEVEEEEEVTSSSSLRRKKKKSSEEEEEEKKILKEIKKVGRQNVITQCLVSVMILLTVAWQISEVSLIFKLKNGVTQPFRSFASIFKTIIKPPPPPPSLQQNPNHHDHHDHNTTSTAADTSTSNLIESTPVHDLNLPNLINLPKIGFNLAQQQD